MCSIGVRNVGKKRHSTVEDADGHLVKISKQQTSILDLPDELLLQIIDHVDLATRLKMRVNRRFEKLIGANTKFDKILVALFLNIYDAWTYRVSVCHSSERLQGVNRWDLAALENGLRRWRLYNPVGEIRIDVQDIPDRRIGPSLDALFCFQSDRLTVEERPHCTFPPLDLAALLLVVEQTKELTINIRCPSIDAVDLCILRENLLKRDCALSSFSVAVTDEDARSFVQKCFGVTIEDRYGPEPMRIFKAADLVQLYSTDLRFPETLMCFKGDLVTIVDRNRVRIKKCNEETKAELMKKLSKVPIIRT